MHTHKTLNVPTVRTFHLREGTEWVRVCSWTGSDSGGHRTAQALTNPFISLGLTPPLGDESMHAVGYLSGNVVTGNLKPT